VSYLVYADLLEEVPLGTTSAALKVAVVDDDREIREALKDALESEGYQVLVVANGFKLLGILAVERPDVILLDVMMSWIDGIDLCGALKKNERYNSIPVVFLSARTSPAEIRRGLDAGAAAYLTKPVDLDQLLERIRDVTVERPDPLAA
jgi:DNA-binding response OmpR family regulator